ncbi:alpha/beta hydrolase [Roseomonas sp. HJA6]|uniref:Alpha/beta hydrolase n=1 Tax=Roseomonas alba TaxID=2846776 RepID=A0ABS7A7V6_9PROT|nr:alpha/beta hydrolase [Neoroseomonas alba]MBW6397415.1 alpha/beta hydrolase [Neoroseomonas alba]
MTIRHRRTLVDGIEIFSREAGDPSHPTVLLLHGFPTSSHMYRALIPRLADRWHVIAPDLPGFGFSGVPGREVFTYGFDALAGVIARFTEQRGLGRFAIMVFDYGAPVGFRLALRNPERIAAVITQNGNAYEAGLSEGWNPIQAYWRDPSEANRAALRAFLAPETTRWQYVHGAHDEALVAPEAWALDQALLDRPGIADIQLDLFLDYRSNVALYPAIQAWLRSHRPPLLAVWGRHDPFFLPAGAEAFRGDVPEAEIHLLDAGHFALETRGEEIAALVRDFLGREHAV